MTSVSNINETFFTFSSSSTNLRHMESISPLLSVTLSERTWKPMKIWLFNIFSQMILIVIYSNDNLSSHSDFLPSSTLHLFSRVLSYVLSVLRKKRWFPKAKRYNPKWPKKIDWKVESAVCPILDFVIRSYI